ncbi:hypothetical protein BY996DRAFT_6491939 [Phakopsora pachyrhizi]|nr:hypothetical protein BY996DRAFT_6491939 [Phakopsora pachyrhizi]
MGRSETFPAPLMALDESDHPQILSTYSWSYALSTYNTDYLGQPIISNQSRNRSDDQGSSDDLRCSKKHPGWMAQHRFIIRHIKRLLNEIQIIVTIAPSRNRGRGQ